MCIIVYLQVHVRVHLYITFPLFLNSADRSNDTRLEDRFAEKIMRRWLSLTMKLYRSRGRAINLQTKPPAAAR